MTAILPTADDLRDLAAYGALMGACARPGAILDLPEPGMGSIIQTLLDRETRVYVQEPELMPTVLQAGAILAELPEADHVLFGRAFTPSMLSTVAVGSDLYPDGGANVFLPARLHTGAKLRLSGPGIKGARDVQIDLPPVVWDIRAKAARYPMGFELWLIDGAEVLGIPRSTEVEVL